MDEQKIESQPLEAPIDTPEEREPPPTPTPRTHVDSRPIPTDSLLTVSLSESNPSSEDKGSKRSTLFDASDLTLDKTLESPRVASLTIERSPEEDEASFLRDSSASDSGTARSSEDGSESSLQVDWEQLDRAEEREDADAESDEVGAQTQPRVLPESLRIQQTTLLLARLEQENAALTADPKSGMKQRTRAQSRPLSVYQLKKLVQEQGARSVRFSLLPAAAPMTELDFWAALVQDYLQTAQRLPTVTSNKIRAGVPVPLRGVVWASMAGARDPILEEQYDGLCQLSSPYETIINKDIGRSFPGVAMFRETDGEGQRMLASVLKCYSLYDKEIGYCQGLGFLVGPLLMNMGDKQAFCVLVRLMEDYDLRSCFLPNLAGLHLRIYQFQQLLERHLPELAQHLAHLQVEGAYLSQWFLSFFATTCPLPLLFRIYDVIFAEGASETIMRVALSIMRRNETKLLGFTEFEDAMQLLLSRALWDPYGLSATSADELVNDFVSFTSVVTKESLQALEAGFREAKEAEAGGMLSFFPSVQQAASRFLQRKLWTSHTPSKSQPLALNPGLSAPSRPHSMLLRTPSKQSLITLSSTGESSEGSISTASTAMTELSSLSRDSSADQISIRSIKSPSDSIERSAGGRLTTMSAKDKDLHCQIEDLLMALTEMQRENATLTAQLQREREERNEDRIIVRDLVDHLKNELARSSNKKDRRKTASIAELSTADIFSRNRQLNEKVVRLVESVDFRMARAAEQRHSRKVSGYETKQQLRQTIANLREQLQNETMSRQDLNRQLHEKDQELNCLREDLSKARSRIKDGYTERERLQKTVRDLRQTQRIKLDPIAVSRRRSGSQGSASEDLPLRSPSISRSDTGMTDESDRTPSTTNGLREFKLGRTAPPPTFAKRTSSLSVASLLNPPTAPTDVQASTTSAAGPQRQPDEGLLQELVASKTAEAQARQELDELKGKFETLRKMMLGGLPTPPASSTTSPSTATGAPLIHTLSIDSAQTVAASPSLSRTDSGGSPSSALSTSFTLGSLATGPSHSPVPSPAPPESRKTRELTANKVATPSSPSVTSPASGFGTSWTGSAGSWAPTGFFGWGRRAASSSVVPQQQRQPQQR